MSRIGKLPIVLEEKIEARINGSKIEIKGPLGTLVFEFSSKVNVIKEEKNIVVSPKDLNDSESLALWGTTRAIISNMQEGVSKGFKKTLEINGVGYKFEVAGDKLILSIGYSHKVDMPVPAGLKVVLDDKLKNMIHISGIDKQLVGEFAAKIRAKKKPEPYKGKGIKYSDETIRRKAGKSGKKK
ncbi:MAG: 50S ribosomal protein L6 [Candidatus Gracilibacteria bacterium]|nr:50S ribosomal protein L6 [Candidatus Gracilibacteria bacterium]